MPKATKNKNKSELIVGLIVIVLAIALLLGLILGVRHVVSLLTFTQPSEKPAVSTTAPPPTHPPLIPNPYDVRDFAYENGFITCLSGEYLLGVDVSEHQGDIRWEKVAAQDIRFAMVRVGARAWGTKGEVFADSQWEENLSGAKAAGLLTGVYFYSQAITEEEAREEARFVLKKLDGRELDLPVVFDWEVAPSADARTANMTAEMLNNCAVAFCEEIKAAGYRPMVYFNLDVSRRMLDLQLLQNKGYGFWLAMYNSALTSAYRVDMWQYTSSATVNGIDGYVDMDLYFIYD